MGGDRHVNKVFLYCDQVLGKKSAPLERRTTETNMQAENWGRKGAGLSGSRTERHEEPGPEGRKDQSAARKWREASGRAEVRAPACRALEAPGQGVQLYLKPNRKSLQVLSNRVTMV